MAIIFENGINIGLGIGIGGSGGGGGTPGVNNVTGYTARRFRLLEISKKQVT